MKFVEGVFIKRYCTSTVLKGEIIYRVQVEISVTLVGLTNNAGVFGYEKYRDDISFTFG